MNIQYSVSNNTQKMLSAIIIVGLQLVDIVDDCNYHNCIMGPFSFVPCPEGPKTGIYPLCTGPYKKSKDYTTMIMENKCIISWKLCHYID